MTSERKKKKIKIIKIKNNETKEAGSEGMGVKIAGCEFNGVHVLGWEIER